LLIMAFSLTLPMKLWSPDLMVSNALHANFAPYLF